MELGFALIATTRLHCGGEKPDRAQLASVIVSCDARLRLLRRDVSSISRNFRAGRFRTSRPEFERLRAQIGRTKARESPAATDLTRFLERTYGTTPGRATASGLIGTPVVGSTRHAGPSPQIAPPLDPPLVLADCDCGFRVRALMSVSVSHKRLPDIPCAFLDLVQSRGAHATAFEADARAPLANANLEAAREARSRDFSTPNDSGRTAPFLREGDIRP
jgi:hypothetical protein